MALDTKKLGNLVISLKGDTKQFDKSMDGAKKSTGGLKASLKGALPAIGAITAAVGVASVAITKVMKTTIGYGTAVDLMTKQADISAEAFTRLAYAAKQEHGSMEGLAGALQKLPKFMQQAKDGMATYLREFDRMGVTVTNADGSLKSALDVLMDMTEYMSNKAIPRTEKTAVAMSLLGRQGAAMVPFLSMGREEIARLGDEAERLGLVLTDIEAQKMKKFDDAITRFKENLHGLTIEIGTRLLPMFEKMLAFDLSTQTEKNSKRIKELTTDIEGWQLAQENLMAQGVEVWTVQGKTTELTYEQQRAYNGLAVSIKETQKEIDELSKKENDLSDTANASAETLKKEAEAAQAKAPVIAVLTEEERKLMRGVKDVTNAMGELQGAGVDMGPIDKALTEDLAGIAAAANSAKSQILNLAYSFENLFAMFGEEGFSLSRFLKALSGIMMMLPGGQGAGLALGLGGIGAGMFGMAQGGLLIPAAQGIMVDRPTPILAGEGGQTEIVSPIDKFFDLVKGLQPNIVVKTGDPSTYVEFVEGLSAGNKDRLWRGSMRGAQARDLAR